jgi:hypothetical protein
MDGMATPTTSALLFLFRPTELGVSAHVNLHQLAWSSSGLHDALLLLFSRHQSCQCMP